MRPFHIIANFARSSLQKDLAYRSNFWISIFHSLINLGVGILSLQIFFNQVDTLRGWNQADAFSLLGVYLVLSSLRGLFIGPSLEALAGLGQEIWSGNFDFSLLKPVPVQFFITFRHWNFYALIDLVLGAVVMSMAGISGGGTSLRMVLIFLITLAASVVIQYSFLLSLTALVFWNPGFLLTWVFDSLFQLARYPVTIYPPWLRMVLTWVIPVGIMTTLPATALTTSVAFQSVIGFIILSIVALLLASFFFNRAVMRYSSASS